MRRRVSKKRKREHQSLNPIEKRNKPLKIRLLEYARSKDNLSKSTDLLQEMVLQSQKQATIHYFFGSEDKTVTLREKTNVCRVLYIVAVLKMRKKMYVEYYTSLLF